MDFDFLKHFIKIYIKEFGFRFLGATSYFIAAAYSATFFNCYYYTVPFTAAVGACFLMVETIADDTLSTFDKIVEENPDHWVTDKTYHDILETRDYSTAYWILCTVLILYFLSSQPPPPTW